MTLREISIQILLEEECCLPLYASPGAAGADVKAYIQEPVVVSPGSSVLVPTGIRVTIPEGYEIQVRPRSGLALKHQVTLVNSPGTIDSDYRGEIKIIMINHGKQDFVITPGMRIAQLVLAPYIKAKFVPTQELVETQRGTGGFGHTGTH